MTVTDGSGDHRFLGDLKALGITAYPLLVRSRGYFSELKGIRRLAEAFRPHVLHTHGYRPGALHPWAVRQLGTPLVTTLHGFTGGGLKNRCYEWIQLRSARRYDAVVAVSRAMMTRLRRTGIRQERTHVIPNGWEARHELHSPGEARAAFGVPSDRFHVGWVGRLSHEKGPDVLLEACTHLGDLDMTASIVGDGGLGLELGARAAMQPRADIRFHGAIPSAARLRAM